MNPVRTFHKAAVDGDKTTMKKCLSKKWLDGLGDNFEKYCDDVREKAKTTPVEHYLKQLPTMKMAQEETPAKQAICNRFLAAAVALVYHPLIGR